MVLNTNVLTYEEIRAGLNNCIGNKGLTRLILEELVTRMQEEGRPGWEGLRTAIELERHPYLYPDGIVLEARCAWFYSIGSRLGGWPSRISKQLIEWMRQQTGASVSDSSWVARHLTVGDAWLSLADALDACPNGMK